MSFVIEDLTWDQALLVVDGGVVFAHILQDAYLWRHLTLHCSSLCQESLDLGPVFLDVVVIYFTFSIHIEDWRLMKVADETKCSALKF
jgi:hypothetical protein